MAGFGHSPQLRGIHRGYCGVGQRGTLCRPDHRCSSGRRRGALSVGKSGGGCEGRLVCAGVRFIEDWFIQPTVLQNAVHLQPVLVLLALMSGAELFGFWVRPSELKKLKNDLYRSSIAFEHGRALCPWLPARWIARAMMAAGPPWARPSGRLAPARERMSPPGMLPVPFVGGDPSRLDLSQLADYAGFRWVPLPPFSWMMHPGSTHSAGSRSETHRRRSRWASTTSLTSFSLALSGIGNVWFSVTSIFMRPTTAHCVF